MWDECISRHPVAGLPSLYLSTHMFVECLLQIEHWSLTRREQFFKHLKGKSMVNLRQFYTQKEPFDSPHTLHYASLVSR